MTFILRKEHEDAITTAMERRFMRRAATFLRGKYPERLASGSDEALDRLVVTGCATARSYGFMTERQLVRFLRSTVLLNDRLEPDSRYRDITGLASKGDLSAEDRSIAILAGAERLAAIGRAC